MTVLPDQLKYTETDKTHARSPTTTRIRYAHTADFKTFTAPQTYVDRSGRDTIDLTILPMAPSPAADGNRTSTFLRFMKDETKKNVYMDYSTSGLFGPWTRPGGDSAVIASGVEGPAAFWDNEAPGKAHLLLDFYSSDGYRPYESTQPESNSAWTASSRTAFPKNLRHGSVLPVTATQYAALATKWG